MNIQALEHFYKARKLDIEALDEWAPGDGYEKDASSPLRGADGLVIAPNSWHEAVWKLI